MQSTTQVTSMVNPISQSRAWLWTGRIISGAVVLFLVFDGFMKVIKEPHVMAATAELGFPQGAIVAIGALLLACTALYAIPRTAILGSILLTGYLGGAVAINVNVRHPVFECLFPVIFGVLAWAGIFLRDSRLRKLVPLGEVGDAFPAAE